jgi:hypothetical protein
MTIHRHQPLNLTFLVCLAVSVLLYGRSVATQTQGSPEMFTAAAIDVNHGQTGRIEIRVNRWSMAAEQETLLAALFKKGSDGLLDVLRDMKATGRISTPGSIGYELRYAQQRPLPDGGREIVLATDRPMSFWEVHNKPRSSDYPFTWAQLKLRADGTGEGQLAVAAKIFGEKADRQIEVETYEIHPVRLTNVTSQKIR